VGRNFRTRFAVKRPLGKGGPEYIPSLDLQQTTGKERSAAKWCSRTALLTPVERNGQIIVSLKNQRFVKKPHRGIGVSTRRISVFRTQSRLTGDRVVAYDKRLCRINDSKVKIRRKTSNNHKGSTHREKFKRQSIIRRKSFVVPRRKCRGGGGRRKFGSPH